MKFHHVGTACHRIDAETNDLAILGYVAEGLPVEDPIQKVRIQFFVGGGPRLELIEPTAPDSPVQGVLKRGSKFYHVAYEVADFETAIADLERQGFCAVGPAAAAVAFSMRRIVFMTSTTLTLVELIEAAKPVSSR